MSLPGRTKGPQQGQPARQELSLDVVSGKRTCWSRHWSAVGLTTEIYQVGVEE